jgi:hypothetical protein
LISSLIPAHIYRLLLQTTRLTDKIAQLWTISKKYLAMLFLVPKNLIYQRIQLIFYHCSEKKWNIDEKTTSPMVSKNTYYQKKNGQELILFFKLYTIVHFNILLLLFAAAAAAAFLSFHIHEGTNKVLRKRTNGKFKKKSNRYKLSFFFIFLQNSKNPTWGR